MWLLNNSRADGKTVLFVSTTQLLLSTLFPLTKFRLQLILLLLLFLLAILALKQKIAAGEISFFQCEFPFQCMFLKISNVSFN